MSETKKKIYLFIFCLSYVFFSDGNIFIQNFLNFANKFAHDFNFEIDESIVWIWNDLKFDSHSTSKIKTIKFPQSLKTLTKTEEVWKSNIEILNWFLYNRNTTPATGTTPVLLLPSEYFHWTLCDFNARCLLNFH